MPPEPSGRGIPDHPLDFPRPLEGVLLHFSVGGDVAPEPADAGRARKVGRRKGFEDGAEDVVGGEGGEIGVHRREDR